MKGYADLIITGSVSLSKNLTAFPDSPRSGQFALVNGALYVYTTIESVQSWYPLTNEKKYYKHTQAIASSSWSVAHGLGTQDLMVAVYDNYNVSQIPSGIVFTDNNSITINFSEGISGKALIFGVGDRSISVGSGSAVLDGTVPVTGNILPDSASLRNLGSASFPYLGVYCDHLYTSGNSIYVNGKKVVEDQSNTIVISTSVDQDLAVKTTGLGDTHLISEALINSEARGGYTFTVPSNNTNKNIVFSNVSTGGNIQFTTGGTTGQVQFLSSEEIDLTAPTIDINGSVDISTNLAVQGNLTVNGTTTTISTTNLNITDKEIVLNSGETSPSGIGGGTGTAGFRFDRGGLSDAVIYFDENDDKFYYGITGGTITEFGSGGGGSGTGVNYVTKSSADPVYTALKDDYILANTSNGAMTLHCPANPTIGDVFYILDVYKTFNLNILTLGGNGSKIEASIDDMELNVPGNQYKMIYTGTDMGWRII